MSPLRPSACQRVGSVVVSSATERQVPFVKMEGTANDFVVLDLPVEALDTATIQALCDRHRGVGADGVLFVPPNQRRMIVRNADGSRPEMCGNGLRCVALHLHRRDGFLEGEILTDAGPRHVVLTAKNGSHAEVLEADVSIGMGRAHVAEPAFVHGIHVTPVNMGNPHAVTFDSIDDRTLDEIGLALQNDPMFPGGVNLERVRDLAKPVDQPRTVVVDVFERGVGRTLACGTGACAVAASLLTQGKLKSGEPVCVTLPGGRLNIRVDTRNDGIYVEMSGPARIVFRGVIQTAIHCDGAAHASP